MTWTRILDAEAPARDRRSSVDRRQHERRVQAADVAVERRSGSDRRLEERRRARARYAWRSPASHASTSGDTPQRSESLKSAAQRTAQKWRSDCGDCVSPAEVRDLLEAIVRAVAARGAKPDARLHSVLGRRLLQLLRAELIGEWRKGRHRAGVDDILATLDAIEAVSAAIEPNWAQYFASRLSGPDGLDLVVEVAHDFRSPLTSILFLAETLQREHSGPVNELQHRQLGLIYGAALGLSEMASNVIELARGGNHLTSEGPIPFSVSEIMESVREITGAIADEKGLAVRIVPPRNDHRLGHPLALSRVLLNLTTNGIKFTERGFIEISSREIGQEIEFSVRDTGPGINPESLGRLYSAFYRAPQRNGYEFSSTGLGLGLCRKLVEALGSELRFETQPGWGTRFYFLLPLPPVSY